jgi:mRNA-degrading endonuclease RelE of RelBE toxin-antitoxin system
VADPGRRPGVYTIVDEVLVVTVVRVANRRQVYRGI